MAAFDRNVALARAGASFEDVLAARGELGRFVPDDEDEWRFWTRIIDHDPVPALRRLAVPLLVLFGEHDRISPVDASIEVVRAAVPLDLLTIAVLPGGDHRVQAGDPPALVDGYAAAVHAFVASALDHAR